MQNVSGDQPIARRFALTELRRWAKDLLQTLGLDESKAEVIADNLVTADARGLGSHGLSRLVIYIERLKRGLVEPLAELHIEKRNCINIGARCR